MTETEKIAYAKSFLDKLAIGINPTDGTIIPEDDVINNPRLSKCFLYVSDILSKIIDNPTIVAKINNTYEWVISPELLSDVECSYKSISLKVFVKNINSTLGDFYNFTAKEIQNWLIHNEYLRRIISNDKMVNVPTLKGSEIGILIDEYTTFNGQTHNNILYSHTAQCFIKEHLTDIVDFTKSNSLSKQKEMTSKQFSLTQDELSKFELSKTPLLISEITHRINNLKTAKDKSKLKATQLTQWLLEKNLLQITTIDEKDYKLPNNEGMKLGISIEHRTGNNRKYSVALYNIEAQKFIIDNLHQIIKIV